MTAAETGQRTGSVIEVLTLQALAHQSAHNEALAGAALARALTLARPEGFLRVFLDESGDLADRTGTARWVWSNR